MADPLSIASGVAGLISLAFDIAQSVSTLISDINDASADIKDLESDIKSLSALLTTTQSLYDIYGKNLVEDAAPFAVTLDICLRRCLSPLQALAELLKPYGKKRNLLRMMRWALKKGEIKALRDRLKDAKASLSLTISVLNGFISGKGQEQIQRDITAGYDMLKREFLNVERGSQLKHRLALDVASVRGTDDSDSVSHNTDAGLPLRRFFASAHEWREELSNVEPPSLEPIASEPGFDADSLDESDPSSALVLAVLSGDRDSVERLLKAGSSILERSPEGLSLLHLCAVTNNKSLAQYILEQDAENTLLNSKDVARRTPFILAVEEKSIEVASLLIKSGCSLGSFLSSMMDLLESGEDDEDVRKLLKPLSKRMNPSSRGPYMVHRAIKSNKLGLIELLLDAGFDPNVKDENGINAIFYAVAARNTKVIKCLAGAEADLNVYLAQGRRPGIGVNEDRECTPLLLAAHTVQDHSTVRMLLDLGARSDFICPKYNDTPSLSQVDISFQEDIVISLVEYGLNVRHNSKHGTETLWREALVNMRDIGSLKVAELRIFTWRVRNWNELYSQKRSPEFECGGQRWRIYLLNAESPRLVAIDPHISSGQWHSNAQFSLGMSNIYDPTVFNVQHAHHRFTKQASDYEFQRFIAPDKLFTIREGQTRPIIEDGSVDVSAVIRVVEDSKGVVWSRLVTYESKKETGYVGLINQGATGYMNCVLQSMFFIRSLRRAIYQIPTEGAVPTASVALALQRLFYNLQTSNGPVATTELTASFGWRALDAHMQHDAHEFHRVLQDKLEAIMKGTSVEETIEKIYVGRMKIYNKCIDVDYENVMVESFSDLELNVRGIKNLRDSFKDYVAVDTLEGAEGILTSQFGRQDAKHGTIFESFPPVLNIRLQRYQFQRGVDRDERVPTTGRYEYPAEIDLSEFLDEAADRSTSWLYKLHGVTVHSGDLKGGYIFTFIKPDRKEGWFKFYNDNVTRVTEEEVLGNYGGESIGTPSGSTDHSITPGLVKTSTKAYLLAYIRDSAIDEVLAPLRDEHIPRHLQSTPDEKKNLVEEQSYLDVKVVTDLEFSRHGRFDLATIDDKNYPPSELPTFRVPKTERYAAFKKRVAERLRYLETKFRLWVMVIRQNKTLRPDLCISENEWSMTIEDIRLKSDKQAELRLYLDLISDDPTEDLAKESSLLLLKFFDPTSRTLNGVGKVYVLRPDKVSALVSAINKRMGWRAGSPLLLYEEIKPGMVEPIKQDRSIAQCELKDGDIICYQPADFSVNYEREMWRQGRYSNAVQYYDFLYRQVMVTFRPKDNAGSTAEFKLALNKDETYDEMAAKVGGRLEADPSKLRFWTTYAGDGALKSVVRKELDESVDELIGSGPSSFLILYQRLETSAS